MHLTRSPQIELILRNHPEDVQELIDWGYLRRRRDGEIEITYKGLSLVDELKMEDNMPEKTEFKTFLAVMLFAAIMACLALFLETIIYH